MSAKAAVIQEEFLSRVQPTATGQQPIDGILPSGITLVELCSILNTLQSIGSYRVQLSSLHEQTPDMDGEGTFVVFSKDQQPIFSMPCAAVLQAQGEAPSGINMAGLQAMFAAIESDSKT